MLGTLRGKANSLAKILIAGTIRFTERPFIVRPG